MVIRLVAVEIKLIVYKIVYASVMLQLEYTAVLLSPCNIDIDMIYMLHLILVLLRYALIKRQNNSCVYALFSEHCGQRARYVAETACFYKRRCLRCGK